MTGRGTLTRFGMLVFVAFAGITVVASPVQAAPVTGPERDEDVPARPLRDARERGRSRALPGQALRAGQGIGLRLQRDVKGHRAEVRSSCLRRSRGFNRAHKAYEEEEGIIAGVPSLVEYDVIWTPARAPADDPKTPYRWTSRFPTGACKAVRQLLPRACSSRAVRHRRAVRREGRSKVELDGDGAVEFGEVLPDADMLVAITAGSTRYASLSARRRRNEPDSLRRPDGARGDGADSDGGLLRRVEELPVHRRQRRAGECVRLALAPDRRARDPVQPGQGLHRHPAAADERERVPEQSDRVTAHRPQHVRRQHLTRRKRAESDSSMPRRICSEARRRSRRTRSPARFSQVAGVLGIKLQRPDHCASPGPRPACSPSLPPRRNSRRRLGSRTPRAGRRLLRRSRGSPYQRPRPRGAFRCWELAVYARTNSQRAEGRAGARRPGRGRAHRGASARGKPWSS